MLWFTVTKRKMLGPDYMSQAGRLAGLVSDFRHTEAARLM